MRFPHWVFMRELHHIFALQAELRALGCFGEEDFDSMLYRQTDVPLRYEFFRRHAASRAREAMQAPMVKAQIRI